MATHRTKPLQVEAWRFDPKVDTPDMPEWVEALMWNGDLWFMDQGRRLELTALSGNWTASPGDWLVKTAEGSLRVVPGDVFSVMYESLP